MMAAKSGVGIRCWSPPEDATKADKFLVDVAHTFYVCRTGAEIGLLCADPERDLVTPGYEPLSWLRPCVVRR